MCYIEPHFNKPANLRPTEHEGKNLNKQFFNPKKIPKFNGDNPMVKVTPLVSIEETCVVLLEEIFRVIYDDRNLNTENVAIACDSFISDCEESDTFTQLSEFCTDTIYECANDDSNCGQNIFKDCRTRHDSFKFIIAPYRSNATVPLEIDPVNAELATMNLPEEYTKQAAMMENDNVLKKKVMEVCYQLYQYLKNPELVEKIVKLKLVSYNFVVHCRVTPFFEELDLWEGCILNIAKCAKHEQNCGEIYGICPKIETHNEKIESIKKCKTFYQNVFAQVSQEDTKIAVGKFAKLCDDTNAGKEMLFFGYLKQHYPVCFEYIMKCRVGSKTDHCKENLIINCPTFDLYIEPKTRIIDKFGKSLKGKKTLKGGDNIAHMKGLNNAYIKNLYKTSGEEKLMKCYVISEICKEKFEDFFAYLQVVAKDTEVDTDDIQN